LTYPLHPIYQLGVSIGELKDLPGMVSQTRRGIVALSHGGKAFAPVKTIGDFLKRARSLPKHSGDTFLYGAFGVAPMLQDLLFLLRMQEKLDKKLRWLRNKNKTSIRRKIELNSESYSEDIARSIAPSSSCFPTLPQPCYAAGQNTSVSQPIRKSYTSRIWFSAKWRIHIPEFALKERPGGPFQDPLSRSLLGLEPNLSTVYKLIPWSWLFNWFTSAGDILDNSSHYAKWGVVAEYAYVMGSETLTYSCPGQVVLHSGVSSGFTWIDPDWSFKGVSSTTYQFRQRKVANPFGFGITYSSLSAFQWSILAALGLSRGGKSSAPRT
jgi:hypothetical protein